MKRGLSWILAALIAATGCHKGHKGVTAISPPAPPAAVVSAIPALLMDAESAFDRNEYLRAANSYGGYLQSGPQSNEMDRILFRYAVAQSLSGVKSLEDHSSETFRQLIHDYPESSFLPPARMGIALQGNVARLEAEKLSRDESIRQLSALLPPTPPLLPAALAEAESAFEIADYPAAAKAYENYLQTRPQSVDMDRILLRFGVAQSMSGDPGRELASNDTFKQLINDLPNSPYAQSARRILALRGEILRLQQSEKQSKDDRIQKLNEELDKLKKIDSERRRTP